MNQNHPNGLRLDERRLSHVAPFVAEASLADAIRDRLPDGPALIGTCRRILLRDGLALSVYDIVLTEGRPQSGEIPAGLTITILLQGAGYSLVEMSGRRARPVPYRAATTYFCQTAHAQRGVLHLPADCRFRAVEFRLSPAFLLAEGLSATLETLDARHALCHIASEGLWVGLVATPEPIAAIAGRLFGNGDDGVPTDLAIEADALDLLFAAFELVRSPRESRVPSARDASALAAAQTLLRSQPQVAWTAASLARRVGLTEKRLRIGFRREFGRSVKAELLRARMDRAHRMLSDQDLSVMAVALTVGIANPSHFAKLFRRQFGVLPSAVRVPRAE